MTRFSTAHLMVLFPLVSGLLVYFGAPVAVQAPVGIITALLVPGFLATLLVRGRYPGTITEVALALIGSIGLLIPLGVVLNLLPWGLSPASWSVALIALTALTVGVLLRQRSYDEPGAGPQPQPPPSSPSPVRRFAPTVAAVVACAALLTAAALVTTTSQRDSVAAQRLTELSLSQNRGVPRVHLTNAEGRPMTYRVVISAAGQPAETMQVTLEDGERWDHDLAALPAKPPASGDQPIFSAALFRGNDSIPYREVHLNRAPS